MTTAASRWTEELAAWSIPADILESVPESPWFYPPVLFRAPDPGAEPETPSRRRALESLPAGGTVLDVGVGGGAASLPLAPRAARVVGVDESDAMLAAFASRADELGVDHLEIRGRWPDVASSAPVADVVVCHNVFYNVPDLQPFSHALGARARHRVVVELTETHPLVAQNLLWRRFHPDVERPDGPTADDAVAVLAEAGIQTGVERFSRPPVHDHSRAEWVAFARRRLCLPREREPEVDAALGDPESLIPRGVVTLWWDTGTA